MSYRTSIVLALAALLAAAALILLTGCQGGCEAHGLKTCKRADGRECCAARHQECGEACP